MNKFILVIVTLMSAFSAFAVETSNQHEPIFLYEKEIVVGNHTVYVRPRIQIDGRLYMIAGAEKLFGTFLGFGAKGVCRALGMKSGEVTHGDLIFALRIPIVLFNDDGSIDEDYDFRAQQPVITELTCEN